MHRRRILGGLLFALLVVVTPVFAQEGTASLWTTDVAVDTLWTLIAGIRVTAEQEAVGLDESEMGMQAYTGDSVAHV